MGAGENLKSVPERASYDATQVDVLGEVLSRGVQHRGADKLGAEMPGLLDDRPDREPVGRILAQYAPELRS